MTPNEFKEIRKSIGLSQAQLGLKLNVGSNHISKIECGKKGITEPNEEKMMALLQEHRQKNRIGTDKNVPTTRPKIRISFPYYNYQNRYLK